MIYVVDLDNQLNNSAFAILPVTIMIHHNAKCVKGFFDPSGLFWGVTMKRE